MRSARTEALIIAAVLERAGLIQRCKNGHVQSCVLDAGPMATAEEWLSAYKVFWPDKLKRFAGFVEAEEASRSSALLALACSQPGPIRRP